MFINENMSSESAKYQYDHFYSNHEFMKDFDKLRMQLNKDTSINTLYNMMGWKVNEYGGWWNISMFMAYVNKRLQELQEFNKYLDSKLNVE